MFYYCTAVNGGRDLQCFYFWMQAAFTCHISTGDDGQSRVSVNGIDAKIAS